MCVYVQLVAALISAREAIPSGEWAQMELRWVALRRKSVQNVFKRHETGRQFVAVQNCLRKTFS